MQHTISSNHQTVSAPLVVRQAGVEDAMEIAFHRAAMFRDMGEVEDGPDFEKLRTASAKAIANLLKQNQYWGWLVECDGRVVGGGGVILRRFLPGPVDIDGVQEAYIVNVYTYPEYRRRGVAGTAISSILAWAQREKIPRVTLHASEQGRPLYAQMGFEPSNEMRFTKKT